MTDVMMIIGEYPFMLATAAYQQMKQTSIYRWKQLDRLGRKPAQQYVGPGSDQISFQGEILPQWNGGQNQINLMRKEAEQGRPLVLISGTGNVLGEWVILKIEESRSEFLRNGNPQSIKFTMNIQQYGSEPGRIAQLPTVGRAVSALGLLE